jgi:hypothetical protein
MAALLQDAQALKSSPTFEHLGQVLIPPVLAILPAAQWIGRLAPVASIPQSLPPSPVLKFRVLLI